MIFSKQIKTKGKQFTRKVYHVIHFPCKFFSRPHADGDVPGDKALAGKAASVIEFNAKFGAFASGRRA